MTMPSGLLVWGQSGEYNAVDDRMVITALATGNRGLDAAGNGLVQAPTFTAGSGLSVTMGPWLAIVRAGDGSSAVIGDRLSRTFFMPAGTASAQTLVLWADISPDPATWQTALLTAAQTTGRLGIALATVAVPANANTSAAMQFTASPITFGRWYADTWAYTTPFRIASTTRVAVPGLAVTLPGRGKYRLNARLLWDQAGVNSTQYMSLSYTSPGLYQAGRFFYDFTPAAPPRQAGQGGANSWGNLNGFVESIANPGAVVEVGMNPGQGNSASLRLEGSFQANSGGLLRLMGRAGSAAANTWFEILIGSWMEVFAASGEPV